MNDFPKGPDEKPPLRLRSFAEGLPLIKARMEEVRRGMGVTTLEAFETSIDPRLVPIQCTPFLSAEEFTARTAGAEVILLCAFASGAMPDRLFPAIQERLNQGVPVIVVSDNPGDDHGILKIIYAAGGEAYGAGAFPLQKVNIKNHSAIKEELRDALDKGLRGREIVDRMRDLYSFKEGETLPLAEWERPGYVAPPPKSVADILRDSGFTDADGNYIPDPWPLK